MIRHLKRALLIIAFIGFSAAAFAQEAPREPEDYPPPRGGLDIALGLQRSEPLGISKDLSFSGFSGKLEANLRFRGLDFSRFYLSFPVAVSAGMERSSQFQINSITSINPAAGVRSTFRLTPNLELGAGLLAGEMIFLIDDITSGSDQPEVYSDPSLRIELSALIQNTPRREGRPHMGIALTGGYGLNFEGPEPGQQLFFSVLHLIRGIVNSYGHRNPISQKYS